MKNFKEEVMGLIRKRDFVSVATCDFNGRPNAAPKFVLKLDEGYIYLIDYTIGTTWKNLTANPRASLAFMDPKTLTGYQINGSVEIIDRGPLYEKICAEMVEKQISLTAKHIIEDIRGESSHDTFAVTLSEKFIVFKVRLEEIVAIGPKGELKRKKILKAA